MEDDRDSLVQEEVADVSDLTVEKIKTKTVSVQAEERQKRHRIKKIVNRG